MTLRQYLYIYLVVLHITAAAILINPSTRWPILSAFEFLSDNTVHNRHYVEMTAFHHRVDKNTPSGAYIFLGDSIIQGLSVSAVTSPAENFGIGGDTTTGIISRIKELTSLRRAKTIVIAIGLNDLRLRDDQEIVANYKVILDSLTNYAPTLVAPILPVDESRWENHDINYRIETINTALSSLCKQTANCFFSDIHPLFFDKQGQLNHQLYIRDGIHLNPRGYRVWIEAIQQALEVLAPKNAR